MLKVIIITLVGIWLLFELAVYVYAAKRLGLGWKWPVDNFLALFTRNRE